MALQYNRPVYADDHSHVHLGDVNYYGGQRHYERLRHVPGALFNAYGTDHRSCHPDTRKEILATIEDWARDSTGKGIFWLNGMAGTGKSTIAYTVAERLSHPSASEYVQLGATFFFRRGEKDRSTATLFFPTIVRQLCQKFPALLPYVDKAVQHDPDICDKMLAEQFKVLVEEPLKSCEQFSLPRCVIVIDALDECQNDDDIRILLQLCSTLSLQFNQSIRWFLTSRPELQIQIGFSRMPVNIQQTVALHEIPAPTIQHDILVYLTDSLSQIRNEHQEMPLTTTCLSGDWPGAAILEELTEIAVPLFIAAATICRFVHDENFDPQDQLMRILKSRTSGNISSLHRTYQPVLDRMLSSLSDLATRTQVLREFCLVVGTIVFAAEPLSRIDLSTLLELSQSTVSLRLRPLQSVLHIPQDVNGQIRALHASFGEFLSSEEMQLQQFYLDRAVAHEVLLEKCLQLMSQPSPNGLCENMCGFLHPGQLRQELPDTKIRSRLSPTLQYACRYWCFHAKHSNTSISDNGKVHNFLQTHFLHWLESLSLLRSLGDVLDKIGTLRSLLADTGTVGLRTFLEDARRFVLAFRYICDRAPLQIYSSAIAFAPQKSVVRNICGRIPSWLNVRSLEMPVNWGSELQDLEGDPGKVSALDISQDGKLLASVKFDKTIHLWDISSGREVQKLEGHLSEVTEVKFSPDPEILVSLEPHRNAIYTWNIKTGQRLQTIEDMPNRNFQTILFTADCSLMVPSQINDRGAYVQYLSLRTGQQIKMKRIVWPSKLQKDGPTYIDQFHWGYNSTQDRSWGEKVVICKNSSVVLFSHTNQCFYYQDLTTRRAWTEIRYGRPMHRALLSDDGATLLTMSTSMAIEIWDLPTEQRLLEYCSEEVTDMVLSCDKSLLVVASESGIKLLDVMTCSELGTLELPVARITSQIVLSPCKSVLAAGIGYDSIRVWDLSDDHASQTRNVRKRETQIRRIAFFVLGSELNTTSVSMDGTVTIWNNLTGEKTRSTRVTVLDDHQIKEWTVTSNGQYLALLISEAQSIWICIWDVFEEKMIQKLEGDLALRTIAISEDGSLVSAWSVTAWVRFWYVATGQELQRLRVSEDWMDNLTRRTLNSKLSFSIDSSLLLVRNGTSTRIWDLKKRQEVLDPPKYGIEMNQFRECDQEQIARRHSAYQLQLQRRPNLCVCEDWVEIKNKRLLWLPQDYRSTVYDARSNTVAIGKLDGKVTFIEIMLDHLITNFPDFCSPLESSV